MTYIETLAKQARKTRYELSKLTSSQKNTILEAIATSLEMSVHMLLEANQKDIEQAEASQMTSAFIDRLRLTEERIQAMAKEVRILASEKDPIDRIVRGWTLDNGLRVVQKTVPLGVIGMIFESRPNVVVEAGTLALKTNNAIILRGGKDSLHSCIALRTCMIEAGRVHGLPEHAIQVIEDASRGHVQELVKASDDIDVLIPRGSRKLKEFILKEARIPVIETGAGNCHIYVDAYAKVDYIASIITNAKLSRPSTCNAVEHILVHQTRINDMSETIKQLCEAHVDVRLDDELYQRYSSIFPVSKATEEDKTTEYNDYVISMFTVKTLEEACRHINSYSTGHSESILTEQLEAMTEFTDRIDSAVVYVNASTRFTDGGVFGFGGEIGIATQKLHARGPMGLEALTSTKYIVTGRGQVR